MNNDIKPLLWAAVISAVVFAGSLGVVWVVIIGGYVPFNVVADFLTVIMFLSALGGFGYYVHMTMHENDV